VIRLDTHVVVWLYAGDIGRLSPRAVDMIESNPTSVSPMVQLELTYLHEIGRLTVTGHEIIGDLRERIGMHLSDASLSSIVGAAGSLTWTRDPFDRMIAADALVTSCNLLTKDSAISDHCSLAVW
jgi:PIN domain nuclease of toxin-antitoxin system